jgi:hypothetical protein
VSLGRNHDDWRQDPLATAEIEEEDLPGCADISPIGDFPHFECPSATSNALGQPAWLGPDLSCGASAALAVFATPAGRVAQGVAADIFN